MKKAIFLIVGAIIIYAFIQYRKLMQYTIKFKNLNFTNLTLGSVSGTMQLDFYNPSALAATLSNYNFDLFVNNQFITTINGNGPFNILPKSTTTLDLDFSVNNVIALGTFLAKAFTANTEPTIQFKGAAVLKLRSGNTKTIPVNLKKPLSYFTEQ